MFLVSFLVDVQKRALYQATQAAADVQDVHTVEDAIASAKRILEVSPRSPVPRIVEKATRTADLLMELVDRRTDEVVATLAREISEVRPEAHISKYSVQWNSLDLAETQLGYRPNKTVHDRSRVITLGFLTQKEWIEIQAHGIGSKFRGLIGIAALFKASDTTAQLASKEPFQVNYAESYESAERRFRPWLEESLTNALTLWRKSL